MCALRGLGVGLLLLSIGAFFIFYKNSKEEKLFMLASLFSYEGLILLFGLLVVVLSLLKLLFGIGELSC